LIKRVRWVVIVLSLLIGLFSVHAQSGPLPPYARLNGLRFEFQTWCNCGPVNLTMALSYYGWPHDQQTAAGWLKPTVEDKNVSPDQMAAYVNQQTVLPNIRALWRYGGSVDVIRALIAAGFPVIIESGFQPEGHEWMGHYETVVAYDDAVQTFWVYDSYSGLGADYLGIQHTYSDLDAWWRHFNRTFIVVYPVEQESTVLALLGPLSDSLAAADQALITARQETAADPSDVWGWFNRGTSAAAVGQYADAASAYDRAFEIGLPFRMIWYQFGPYAAYYYTGRYYDVLAVVRDVEAITLEIEDTSYWKGLALAALGRTDEALAEFNRAIAWNPHFTPASDARDQVLAGQYVAPAPLTTTEKLP